jgi:hypothetical protein
MADCQITCIVKPQRPHEHITHVGNPPTWVWPPERVIASTDNRSNTFFVTDPRTGRRADVGVVREVGKAPYLRTQADGYFDDNLLALDQCPVPR